MSTSVDQRMKGQGGPVTNGPKDQVNDEEFDSWRNQTHQAAFQGYNPPVSASSMGDPYMSSYYGMSFPYQNLGLSEGAWSNGGETMTFLSGYGGQMAGEQHSHYVDSMLNTGGGSFGGFSQPGFNYFHGGNGGDYSAWGTGNVGGGRKPANHAHYDDYYGDMYGGGADRGAAAEQQRVGAGGMKPVEQGMQGLSIADKVAVDPAKMDAMKGGCGGPVDFVAKDGGVGGPGGMVLATGGGQGGGGSQAPKKMTWASIASQPAKPQPKIKPKSIPPAPVQPGKHNMDIGTWESKNGNGGMKPGGGVGGLPAPRPGWGAPRGRGGGGYNNGAPVATGGGGGGQHPGQGGGAGGPPPGAVAYPAHPVLDKLRQSNEYNPKEFELSPKNARFFIIKSYSEDDIHRSIKYGIWCSTEHGNKRLDSAFRDQEAKGAALLLFFSVNGSGHFCGVARMMSHLDYNSTASVWAQDKWKGEFKVKWIYVKDVPNSQLRHIRLENNENKPVTNSRDTQEVPVDKGRLVLKIIHNYRHTTSIFDDFVHYEKRQEEEDQRKQETP